MRVVILGGGPAGAAAALVALKGHVPVTIVERSQFPRYRPGETLHPGIEPLLAKIGVAGILHEGGYLRHEGIWSAWAEPKRFAHYGSDVNGPWRGFQAIRDDFDHRLLEAARTAGAELSPTEATAVLRDANGKVQGVQTDAGAILCDYVIDCTGGSQIVAKWLGIPMIRHSPRLIARFGYVTGTFRGDAPLIQTDSTGWTWIAEVQPGRFHWTRVTEAHNRPSPSWLPSGLKAQKIETVRGADVSWRLAKSVAGPGYFLAGDAAAVLDPSSSHGVLRAIMSGMMAAHLAVEHLRHEADASLCAMHYQEWLSSWFREDAAEMTRMYRRASLFGFGSCLTPGNFVNSKLVFMPRRVFGIASIR